jgi:hypothetical protein
MNESLYLFIYFIYSFVRSFVRLFVRVCGVKGGGGGGVWVRGVGGGFL